MMTKKEFALAYLTNYSRKHDIPFDELHSHICESGCLGVALEYLDMLSDIEKDYANARGGIFMMYAGVSESGRVPVLTMRDMLDLLPDTVEKDLSNETLQYDEELVSGWVNNVSDTLRNTISETLDEIDGAIANERIWDLGDGADGSLHTQNICNLMEYRRRVNNINEFLKSNECK